jgi:hypothetical protein
VQFENCQPSAAKAVPENKPDYRSGKPLAPPKNKSKNGKPLRHLKNKSKNGTAAPPKNNPKTDFFRNL